MPKMQKTECRICGNSELEKFLSLGISPLANNFLKKEDIEKEEPKFPLELCFCNNCKLVQLSYVVSPKIMFKNYLYVSSTSNTFRQHFEKMAEHISKRFSLNENSLVVDIGSNDGILLKSFKDGGAEVIGVEPAANIARIAESNGVETINDFFNSRVVEKIINEKGYADIVTANNVFAHIDDIQDFVKNVKNILKKDGIFLIEVQYLVDMLEKMTFDNIYHEHLSYFSLTSLDYFFSKNGMSIFDVQRIDTHGGSLRVFIKNIEGYQNVSDNVNNLLECEKKIGIDNFETYLKLSDSISQEKKALISEIKKIKSQGKKIFGYGAPAKSTTLLNFCGIGCNEIDCIIEDSPLKIGLFAPGTNIPIVSPKILDEQKPDYILILAWNFSNEIMAKSKKYSDKIKFIIPLPKPEIA